MTRQQRPRLYLQAGTFGSQNYEMQTQNDIEHYSWVYSSCQLFGVVPKQSVISFGIMTKSVGLFSKSLLPLSNQHSCGNSFVT